jgi:hypothetical protein
LSFRIFPVVKLRGVVVYEVVAGYMRPGQKVPLRFYRINLADIGQIGYLSLLQVTVLNVAYINHPRQFVFLPAIHISCSGSLVPVHL